MTGKHPLDLHELFSSKQKSKKHKQQHKHENEEEQQQEHEDPDVALREASARQSVVDLLERSLSQQQEDSGGTALAEAIEHELYLLHGEKADKGYKTATRNLVANLKRNAALVERVSQGDVTPAQLVRMTPAEMATAEQQQELARSHDKLLRAATLNEPTEAYATEHVCPECKSTACTTVESLSLTAAKTDTWGSKQHEGKGAIIKCLTCGHKWELALL